jgi:hypothetical protein
MNAMAVTNFGPAADPEVFDGWIWDVRSAAEAAQGFVAFAASISRMRRWTGRLLSPSNPRTCPSVARRGDVEALGARRRGTWISAAYFGFGDR